MEAAHVPPALPGCRTRPAYAAYAVGAEVGRAGAYRKTECARLAALLNLPEYPGGSRDAAPEPAHRLLLGLVAAWVRLAR